MQIIKGSRKLIKKIVLKNPVVTLGNFDGVHRGHQRILQKVIQRAKAVEGISAVYTFNPHPLEVLKPEQAPLKITTFEEKANLIDYIGIDYLITETFTKRFSEQSPEEFVKTIICDRMHPREIVIGHDYAFGKNRQGAVELLKKMGQAFHFRVHVVSDIKIKNIPVRSTTLRNLISSGKVSLAQKLMGRPYCLTGKVVHGKQRKIGFPTANLNPAKRVLLPGNGVYAICAATPYGKFNGVVSIGYNPTFEGKKRTIEAHMFNLNKNLYGKEITIYWIKRIRSEKKFPDAETLAAQIEKDIAFAKKILNKTGFFQNTCPQISQYNCDGPGALSYGQGIIS
jgi:riboflavin kinase/FMN adenylyltransferase